MVQSKRLACRAPKENTPRSLCVHDVPAGRLRLGNKRNYN